MYTWFIIIWLYALRQLPTYEGESAYDDKKRKKGESEILLHSNMSQNLKIHLKRFLNFIAIKN
jgi:hypothetical protein